MLLGGGGVVVVVLVAKRRGEIPTGHQPLPPCLRAELMLGAMPFSFSVTTVSALLPGGRRRGAGDCQWRPRQAHGRIQDLLCAKGTARASRRGVVEEGELLRPQPGLPVGVKARTKHSPTKSVTARYS